MTTTAPASETTTPQGARVAACDGLVKDFGERRAVDDISFHISPGETYGLLGPNGAGKTTSISMLCGLIEPDAGAVHILGRDLSGMSDLKGHIGLAPQEIALYPDLSARENLDFFGRLQGLDRGARRARIAEVLDIVGLADRADDRVSEYSGGMQRRCNIAAGLIHEPRLLVLDEPTVGVDPQSRNQILESIERLGGEGLAVLYTTHYMEEAERLCDRIGIMDQGRMIAEGSRRELVAQIGEHDHIHVAADANTEVLRQTLADLAFTHSTSTIDGVVDVAVDSAHTAVTDVVQAAAGQGLAITSIEIVEPDLETVFLHLTGRALRD